MERMIDNIIDENRLGVWNQIKLLYETGGFPFLNKDMISLEEVYCKDGEMPLCVKREMITYKYEKYNFDSPGLTDENFDSPGLTDEISIDENKTRQYPRDENLVDKLPKVILTFQKYDKEGLIDNKYTKIIEYDGIYNINNQFIKLGRNNLLKFIEESLIKHLEFKEGGTKEEKIKNHKLKMSSIINTTNHNHDFNKEINFTLQKDIKINPKFNINFKKIFKCQECSEFITE